MLVLPTSRYFISRSTLAVSLSSPKFGRNGAVCHGGTHARAGSRPRLSWRRQFATDPQKRDHNQRRPGSGRSPSTDARRRASVRRRISPPRCRRETPDSGVPTVLIRTPYNNASNENIRKGRALADYRLRLRYPGRARTLGLRRTLVALRHGARGRLRHPGLDRRTALEQRPHRHVRPFLPGFGPVAQRAPGASKPYACYGAAVHLRGLPHRPRSPRRRIPAWCARQLGPARGRAYRPVH